MPKLRLSMMLALILFLALCVGPAAQADVYIYKGLGGVWSSGLTETCAFLTEKKGIKCHFGVEPVQNGKPIVLVGHSMGGATAINYAMANKVATVILLDPVGSVEKLPARTISVHSNGWGNRVGNAAMVVHCQSCSHTSIDDDEGVQFLIIREAVNAHIRVAAVTPAAAPVQNLKAVPAAPTVQKKVTWRKRR